MFLQSSGVAGGPLDRGRRICYRSERKNIAVGSGNVTIRSENVAVGIGNAAVGNGKDMIWNGIFNRWEAKHRWEGLK